MISKAPSRLSPNTIKTIAIKAFTHGFEPSCTTPNGPTRAVTASPIAVKQHNDSQAEERRLPQRLAPRCRFKKNESVIGIIGKTHGVKIAARPNPKATRRKLQTLGSRCLRRGSRQSRAPLAGELGVAAGIACAPVPAAGSTFKLQAQRDLRGRHSLSVQA